MATTFKSLTNNDIASTRTLLHEAIPITGTIISGTYNGASVATGSEYNIKNYAHKMFQSVYDYPYLSSSANHLFDITVGYATSSALNNENDTSYHDKKTSTYNQMAQVLMGFDSDGDIQLFDKDGDLTGGSKITEAIFLNFSRLLVKDEIKKGSFQMTIETGSLYRPNDLPVGSTASFIIGDSSGSSQFKVNSPAGEYGILYEQSSPSGPAGVTQLGAANPDPYGLIFYQAGVVVLNMSGTLTGSKNALVGFEANEQNSGPMLMLTGSDFSQEDSANAWRTRIYNIKFNNTVELNSTVYFCRANHNEFNYSANPTYTTNSKIRVKANVSDQPVSYITSVGLYSADNELLAVAKLSEPLKKDPTNEITLRVRLDY